MKNQNLSEEFLRMQKLAGINQLNENVNLLQLLQNYISAEYDANEGFDIENSQNVMKQIAFEVTKLKGAQYFNYLKKFSNLNMDIENSTSDRETSDIKSKLESISQKLGFTVNQLMGI